MSDIDIRTATYDEALSDYLEEADAKVLYIDPADVVKQHNLKPALGVDPRNYPAGTWFYYVDGKTYIREVGQ
jgi:hypothetical protein